LPLAIAARTAVCGEKTGGNSRTAYVLWLSAVLVRPRTAAFSSFVPDQFEDFDNAFPDLLFAEQFNYQLGIEMFGPARMRKLDCVL
jgi:hypothetical protein